MQRYRRLFLLTLLFAGLAVPAWADDTIYTKVDVNPVPIKTPPPAYPDEMKVHAVSGTVALSIVIDETGAVASSSVVKSTHPQFEGPALDAIKKWKFKPAQKDGTPVKMRLNVPIRFSADEG
jgi:protein TonB